MHFSIDLVKLRHSYGLSCSHTEIVIAGKGIPISSLFSPPRSPSSSHKSRSIVENCLQDQLKCRSYHSSKQSFYLEQRHHFFAYFHWCQETWLKIRLEKPKAKNIFKREPVKCCFCSPKRYYIENCSQLPRLNLAISVCMLIS